MAETPPAGAAPGPSWRAAVGALAVGQILNWALGGAVLRVFQLGALASVIAFWRAGRP